MNWTNVKDKVPPYDTRFRRLVEIAQIEMK